MKYFTLLSAFLLLSTSALVQAQNEDFSADPQPDDDSVTPPESATDSDKDFNSKLDAIIKETAHKHKTKITPLNLEDKIVTFNRKVVLVNVTGSVGFQNISLHGLDTIKRVGDAYLSKTKYGNIELKVKLAVDNLSLKADGLVQFMGFTSRSSYELTLESVEGSTTLHFYPKTEEIYVKSSEMGKLNGLRFQITKSPLIFTPFVVNQVSRASIALFKPAIEMAVDRAAGSVLQAAVKDSTFLKNIMTAYAETK